MSGAARVLWRQSNAEPSERQWPSNDEGHDDKADENQVVSSDAVVPDAVPLGKDECRRGNQTAKQP